MTEGSKGTGKKRVWILGAGFSRPLGAPLLNDLFSMRMWRKVSEVFPETFSLGGIKSRDLPMLAVYLLYNWGRNFPDLTIFGSTPAKQGESLFSDAESFMVDLELKEPAELSRYLGLALDSQKDLFYGHLPNVALVKLANHHLPNSKELIQAAKRLMAFECSAFHQELINSYSDPGERAEPYVPYQVWGRNLDPERDVLITFNYDLVVEEVAKPHEDIPLFHLHGSVSQVNIDGQVTIAAKQPYLHLKEQAATPNIKVPGRSKAEFSDEDKKTWSDAQKQLQEADEVIFMGYGLPESDAYARMFILDSLCASKSRVLDIQVVLGEPNFRTKRLESTIRQALAHRTENIQAQTQNARNIASAETSLMNFESYSNPQTREELEVYNKMRNSKTRELEQFKRFRGLKLKVCPQYAQDYMQAFATAQQQQERNETI